MCVKTATTKKQPHNSHRNNENQMWNVRIFFSSHLLILSILGDGCCVHHNVYAALFILRIIIYLSKLFQRAHIKPREMRNTVDIMNMNLWFNFHTWRAQFRLESLFSNSSCQILYFTVVLFIVWKWQEMIFRMYKKIAACVCFQLSTLLLHPSTSHRSQFSTQAYRKIKRSFFSDFTAVSKA